MDVSAGTNQGFRFAPLALVGPFIHAAGLQLYLHVVGVDAYGLRSSKFKIFRKEYQEGEADPEGDANDPPFRFGPRWIRQGKEREVAPLEVIFFMDLGKNGPGFRFQSDSLETQE